MIRYPYHRYLRYQVLNGDSADEIRQHMVDLQYATPLLEDVDELKKSFFGRLVDDDLRASHGVGFFDDRCESLGIMFWIVEEAVVRTLAERLLLDKVAPGNIATILQLKFNEKVTKKSIELFRDGFWDTSTLTPLDFTQYFRIVDDRKPDPPPMRVSLKHRPSYSAWDQGLTPQEDELSVEDMLREVTVDSFMQFKKMQSSANVEDHKQAMQYAALFMKAAPARKAVRFGDGSKGDAIPVLKPIVEYPDNDVPTLSELHRRYADDTSGTGSSLDAVDGE